MEVPDFFLGGDFGTTVAGQFSPEKQVPGEHFAIDDLFDFPNEDATLMTDGFLDNVAANSMDSSSSVTAVESCNSSLSGRDNHFSHSFDGSHFSGELCLLYDDNLAELEWLSNFVEDSFTAKETELPAVNFTSCTANATVKLEMSHQMPFSSGMLSSIPFKTCKTEPVNHHVENALPSKARSKRTARATPCDWSTRLFPLPNPSDPAPPKTVTIGSSNPDSSCRKCLHCATEKTPQWRTGPMGPKTLCNACGVRYKSGRLVPEYRPASSPTFVPAKHSNSHRKVLELQRARAVAHQQQQQQQQFISQSSIFGISNGGDDYLIHSQAGPRFVA